MNHIKDIKSYLKIMRGSDNFNALIVKSLPGWAKSTTIHAALEQLGLSYKAVGSYSTPLAFYKALAQNRKGLIVLDDCAGLFTNVIALSVLKAATWPSVGSKERRLQWNSMTQLLNDGEESGTIDERDFVFEGKLILLTNSMPDNTELAAFKSRCIFYNIEIGREEVKDMLEEAAHNKKYFPNQRLAKAVSNFLIEEVVRRDFTQFNLRTLTLAYELAQAEKTWKQSLLKLLPKQEPAALVRTLAESGTNVEDQAHTFMARTGMTRMTFFRFRNMLHISNPENSKLGRKGMMGKLQNGGQIRPRGTTRSKSSSSTVKRTSK